LESWIEHDPGLVQAGLVIVGRRVHTDAGRIDLLALDVQDRWVVIEIKRGSVRRDTLAQVIDYASVIAALPSGELRDIADRYLQGWGRTLACILDEREAEDSLDVGGRQVLLVVVGTAREPRARSSG
jgi:Holliday junction resolvase-like predicted endonuclease